MLSPSDRIKQLTETSLTVDPTKNVHMYYRSGPQMIDRAKMYLSDNQLEEAYRLYFKFIVLFVEEIRKHPDFQKVTNKVRDENRALLKGAMQKAEELKEKLIQKYTREYCLYLEQQEKHKQEETGLKKRQEEQNHQQALLQQRNQQLPRQVTAHALWETDINSQPSLSGVNYPQLDVISPKPAATKSVNNWHPPDYFEPKDSRIPTVDRSTKPVGVTNSHQTQRLKSVVVPSDLSGKFQSLAHKATLNNIETCGILAGRLVGRDLVITHVLIPKQHGTSNSCTAENEEEVFDYQDQNNIITLGWIHTHPSQTAFLSSVDLHTHCPYQLMMPEAIAIVCAPKYKEDGIFCLTPDYGLDFISKCRQTGFHPHPTDPELYTQADHVMLDNSRQVQIVDLRR